MGEPQHWGVPIAHSSGSPHWVSVQELEQCGANPQPCCWVRAVTLHPTRRGSLQFLSRSLLQNSMDLGKVGWGKGMDGWNPPSLAAALCIHRYKHPLAARASS